MLNNISIFLSSTGGSGGGGHFGHPLPDFNWDWDYSLEEFRQAAYTAIYYLTLVTSWILSNPWTATIFCISVIAAVLLLIRAAKDAVE